MSVTIFISLMECMREIHQGQWLGSRFSVPFWYFSIHTIKTYNGRQIYRAADQFLFTIAHSVYDTASECIIPGFIEGLHWCLIKSLYESYHDCIHVCKHILICVHLKYVIDCFTIPATIRSVLDLMQGQTNINSYVEHWNTEAFN